MKHLALFMAAVLLFSVFASSLAIKSANAQGGLVAYWKFDEGTGTTVSDSSGHGNHGTIYGATWVAGKYGNALQFDGVDDYVDVPDSSSLDITGQIEISVWIKAGPQTDTSEIIDKGDGGIPADAGYALRISRYEGFDFPNAGPNEPGHALFLLCMAKYPNWPDFSIYINSMTRVDDNNWHFIDATYDGAVMKMYIGGILETTFSISSAIYTNNRHLRIGSGYPSGRFFNGTIDEVKIYGGSYVGGVVISVDKFGLLLPYVGSAFTISVAAVAALAYAKRRKNKRTE